MREKTKIALLRRAMHPCAAVSKGFVATVGVELFPSPRLPSLAVHLSTCRLPSSYSIDNSTHQGQKMSGVLTMSPTRSFNRNSFGKIPHSPGFKSSTFDFSDNANKRTNRRSMVRSIPYQHLPHPYHYTYNELIIMTLGYYHCNINMSHHVPDTPSTESRLILIVIVHHHHHI